MRLVKYKLEMVKEEEYEYGGSECIAKNPFDVYKALIEVYKLDKQSEEVLYCICLDVKGRIIGVHEVSRGTLTTSLVSPREVFKRAILNNANTIIMAHNHPSGDVDYSKNDKEITERLVKAGEILSIPVVDHVIVGDGSYFSFKENKMI